MTIEEKREITKHISKVGGFNEKSKGYHAVENLLILGEWSFQWYEKSFCLQNASWLQHIGLDVEVRSDVVKVSDEAIEKYYRDAMGLIPKFQPVDNNLSKGDRQLSIGKEERETSNWAEKILANKKDSTVKE